MDYKKLFTDEYLSMGDEKFKKSILRCIFNNVSLDEIISTASLKYDSYKDCEEELSNLYDEMELKQFADMFSVITDDDILYDVIIQKSA